MSKPNRSSRRRFLTTTAQGAALISLGAAVSKTSAAPSYRRIASIDTGAKQARSIAIGARDRIYIAADKAVLEFDAGGKQTSRIDLDRPPRCLKVNEDGNLLIGFKEHIAVYTPKGEKRAEWQSLGRDASLTSIDANCCEVFASDAGNKVVWRFTSTGELLGKIEREGAAFAPPRAFFPVAVDGLGNIYIVNPGRHAVEVYNNDGRFVSSWGGKSRDLEGFGGCCNPVALAVLPDGRFITAERGQPRIKLHDATGRFASLIAGPEMFTHNAEQTVDAELHTCQTGGLEIAVDSRNRVLVLDRVTAQV